MGDQQKRVEMDLKGNIYALIAQGEKSKETQSEKCLSWKGENSIEQKSVLKG